MKLKNIFDFSERAKESRNCFREIIKKEAENKNGIIKH